MTELFSEVLKMSLSAAFLVAIILCIRLCLRHSPKWVHCALWALVAVWLVFPSLPESHLSMVPKRVSEGEIIVQVVEEMPPLRPAPLPQESPRPTAPEWEEVPAVTEPSMEAEETGAPIPWMTILAAVWLAGVAAMGLYAFFSYVRILKKVGPCVDAGDGVFLCDYIDTPFLLGFRRPRIYMPSHLSPETAAYVLAHERAHLNRRDHWWKPIGFILLSIHWFNPMIWLGYCLLCRDIEMACDEAVVKTMGSEDKKGYSHALLTCSLPRSTISICPLAFGEVSVKERIKSVLSYKKPALWLTLVGIIAVALGAVFFLTNPEKNAAPEGVEYLPTAVYTASRDELTIYEYDDEYRPIRTVNYDAGVEDIREEYSYKRRGDTLTRTLVCTHAPYSKSSDKPTSHSTSIDGVDVRPGQTVTLVYEERLDEHDHVLESVLSVDGEWFSTRTFTYDEGGNVLTKTLDARASISKTQEHRYSTTTYAYDALGNVLSQKNVTKTLGGTTTYERRWTRDEEGNALGVQYYHNDRLIEDSQNTLDENGRPLKTVSNQNGGVTAVYSYSRDEAATQEFVTAADDKGSILSRSIHNYDERGNALSTYNLDGDYKLASARNYIGTDGFQSTGIPEEIYTEGEPVHANPEIYSIPVPEVPSNIQYVPSASFTPESAKSAMLYDAESGRVICEHHPDARVAPGALTKLVTAFLALERCDPEETVETKSATGYGLPAGALNMDLKAGEVLTVRDLTAALVLNSANDAALALADHVAGSPEAFVEKMNHWARDIGCTDTEFGNVHGLPTEDSHTTARDMVKMVEAALKNDSFRKLFQTKKYTIPASQHSKARELLTMNYMMDMAIIPDFYDDRVTGGMQSYSKETGASLVCTLDNGAIAVVFEAERTFAENGWQALSYGNFEEMHHMMDACILDPNKVAEVAYYPSAKFEQETGTMTLYDYDESFHLLGKTVYRDGVEAERIRYSYTGMDAEADAVVSAVSTSPDGTPAAEYTYHKLLDENGNISQSTCYREGQWQSTHQYFYDKFGQMTKALGRNATRVWQLRFDNDSVPSCTLDFTDAPKDGRTEPVWNTNAEVSCKTCLQAMFDRDALYFHEIDGYVRTLEIDNSQTLYANISSVGNADSLDYSLQMTDEDGRLMEGQTASLDDHGNIRELVVYDKTLPGDHIESYLYYNYIGSDGTESIGIPGSVYTDLGWHSRKPDENATPYPRLSMELAVTEAAPTGATLSCKLTGTLWTGITTGDYFQLERKTARAWEKLAHDQNHGWKGTFIEKEDMAFDGEAYSITWDVDWTEAYGILPAGTYRIGTSLTDSGAFCYAEFTIAGTGSEAAEEALRLCMRSLNGQIDDEFYHLETECITSPETLEGLNPRDRRLFGDGLARTENLRCGNDYLYTSRNAAIPDYAWVERDGLKYQNQDGSWTFYQESTDSPILNWYENYIFAPDRLTLVSDATDRNVREITFRVDPRPDEIITRKDHTITYRFIDNHLGDYALLSIVETGRYTEFNGAKVDIPFTTTMKVLSTARWTVSGEFQKRDMTDCEAFTAPDFDGNLGSNLRLTDFRNTDASPVKTPADAYQRAKREMNGNYHTAQVYRDDAAKLWRVDFRDLTGYTIGVYLDDKGMTKMIEWPSPAFNVPTEVEEDEALVRCREAMAELQKSDSYHIVMSGEPNPTEFLRNGTDMLYSSIAREGTVTGRFHYLRRGNEKFRIVSTPIDSQVPIQWEPVEALLYEDFQPWLFSFDAENLDHRYVQDVKEEQGGAGHTVTVSIDSPYVSPYDDRAVADGYQVEFCFDEAWDFEKAVLKGHFRYGAGQSENDGVQTHTMTVVSTDQAEIAEKIEEAYKQAVSQNNP